MAERNIPQVEAYSQAMMLLHAAGVDRSDGALTIQSEQGTVIAQRTESRIYQMELQQADRTVIISTEGNQLIFSGFVLDQQHPLPPDIELGKPIDQDTAIVLLKVLRPLSPRPSERT